MDTFALHVESVSGNGRDAMAETPVVSRVSVLAASTNDAELAALQMVAARGRNPISVAVDWEDF